MRQHASFKFIRGKQGGQAKRNVVEKIFTSTCTWRWYQKEQSLDIVMLIVFNTVLLLLSNRVVLLNP